ncbi:Gfo/Idh/MocA family protein [Aestuariibius sp. HNIBRBA575]|uniref:Gfo/Idh/MocA family protein n=1 Tax=Aestuariibius sp. HNIBRBA575 TaxID=3233343 RepID=UPI0034A1536A
MEIILCAIGKIARDQHIPAIAASKDWDLAATVSRSGGVDGVPGYTNINDALEAHPDVQVYSLCHPAAPRYDVAKTLIENGKDVMLEKPPGATLAEIFDLERRARDAGVSLYATWHSRQADGVQAAADWLKSRTITRAHITWREDVRLWHPGQDWVFDPGGMGVFDPGINALSILTHILPDPVHLTDATLEFPSNRAMPIAADLTFSGHVTADFDWRQDGPQTWEIEVETTDGTLILKDGGARLFIDGQDQNATGMGEYPALYAQMADLVRDRKSNVDLAPMIHLSDAFTLGRRKTVDAFEF